MAQKGSFSSQLEKDVERIAAMTPRKFHVITKGPACGPGQAWDMRLRYDGDPYVRTLCTKSHPMYWFRDSPWCTNPAWKPWKFTEAYDSFSTGHGGGNKIVTLVLDVSGSMGETTEIAGRHVSRLEQCVENMLMVFDDHIQDNDFVSHIQFASYIGFDGSECTSDPHDTSMIRNLHQMGRKKDVKDSMRTMIRNASAADATSFWDTMSYAAEASAKFGEQYPDLPQYIIALTDGNDNASWRSTSDGACPTQWTQRCPARLKATFEQHSQITPFVIGAGNGFNDYDSAVKQIREMVGEQPVNPAIGGMYISSSDDQLELRNAFQMVASHMRVVCDPTVLVKNSIFSWAGGPPGFRAWTKAAPGRKAVWVYTRSTPNPKNIKDNTLYMSPHCPGGPLPGQVNKWGWKCQGRYWVAEIECDGRSNCTEALEDLVNTLQITLDVAEKLFKQAGNARNKDARDAAHAHLQDALAIQKNHPYAKTEETKALEEQFVAPVTDSVYAIKAGAIQPSQTVGGDTKMAGTGKYIRWDLDLGKADFTLSSDFHVALKSGTALTFVLWSGDTMMHLGLDGGGNKFFYEGGEWGKATILGPTTISPGTLHTLLVVRSGGRLTVSLDGSPVPGMANIPFSSAVTAVGWRPWRNSIEVKTLQTGSEMKDAKYVHKKANEAYALAWKTMAPYRFSSEY